MKSAAALMEVSGQTVEELIADLIKYVADSVNSVGLFNRSDQFFSELPSAGPIGFN